MLKISKWDFNSTWTESFQMFKLDLERQRNQRSNCQCLLDHWKMKRVPEKHLFLLYGLRLSLWWRRQWHPTPVLLPGKSHGWRSLVGCTPWGRWGSDMTEWLHFRFSLSYIGEGKGNPLQCSCLENLRDGGAWWAAVYGVTQSQTRLKWFSSSKPLTVWITTNCGKFFKKREYQTTWPASWEIWMWVKKQQLELDMEQQTGSK